ncbi:hypothetical protein [Chondrinema litorale]|uniref:hypothetical protein n=1 Tax=Chondrinema litorale TaxID=2994555 RepID=UPI002542D845|nr:hypothetical protein [Chondrinema litorale]UZR94227.1 hypothetical protein OQ292_00120 [Chondrinema litorale]
MKILFSFPVLILLLCISLTGMENAYLQKTEAESMDLINSIFSLILIGSILLKAIFSGKKKSEKEEDKKEENKKESPFGALEASIIGKAQDGAEFYLVKMPQAKQLN